MQKAALPKGTRDFGPDVMRRRNFITDTIVSVYKKFGFQPIETPAMENLSTLLGKYGDEGDKLLFKILNSGDFLKKVNAQELEAGDLNTLGLKMAEKGLRYDLTIPFARFVVQHRNDIHFPFRRYQIQPVWRADRPQKGRYREFWQCDADVIGTDSMVAEIDLIQIYSEVFNALGFSDYLLKINHRKLLEAVAITCEMDSNFRHLTVCIDKLDKIGWEGVEKELANEFPSESIEKLKTILINGEITPEFLDDLNSKLTPSPALDLALKDLREIMGFMSDMKLDLKMELDLSLARGLDYYTGCIFEALIPDSGIGSVSGGGRYDDLTGVFGMKDVSGVGISFGIDRLYDVMEHFGLFRDLESAPVKLLLAHFDEKSRAACIKLARDLRALDISVQVYPDLKKIKKQLDYANKNHIPYVGVIGDDEIASGSVQLKNMQDGEQVSVSQSKLGEALL